MARQVPNQPTVVLCGWEAVVTVVLVAMLPLVLLLLLPPAPVLPVLLRVSPSYWSATMACEGLIRRAGQPRHCVTRASWHSTTTSWWAWHAMKQSRKREEPGVGASTTPKEVFIHQLLIHILTTPKEPPKPSPGPQERVEAHVKRHRPNKGRQPKDPRAQFN